MLAAAGAGASSSNAKATASDANAVEGGRMRRGRIHAHARVNIGSGSPDLNAVGHVSSARRYFVETPIPVLGQVPTRSPRTGAPQRRSWRTSMRSRQATRALVAVAAAAAMLATTSPAFAATSSDTTQFSVTPGSLAFSTAPDVPNLPALTLNGQTQTLNGTMNNFGVDDATGSASGWNVTVSGDNSAGKSAVCKRYCTQAGGCGGDAFGYVSSGASLAANSLTLNSTSASFSAQNGTTGTAPTHQCS